ncbi:unnamed protein product [Prorocentrum cordatum]|uniref:LRRK2 ARM repeat domain-containing protein n=1 Tax=Prorocentrum cordatum TaxID=2364126 RepID=A0ABN9TSR1_9DINO|nr:unnamed protein product [Polarella glacialis]
MFAWAPASSPPTSLGASHRDEEVVEVETKGGPALCGSLCPGWLPAPAAAGRGAPPAPPGQAAGLPRLLGPARARGAAAGKGVHQPDHDYQGASKVQPLHLSSWEQEGSEWGASEQHYRHHHGYGDAEGPHHEGEAPAGLLGGLLGDTLGYCGLGGRRAGTAHQQCWQGPAATEAPAPQAVRLSPRDSPTFVLPRRAPASRGPPPPLAASAQERRRPQSGQPPTPGGAAGVATCPTCHWVCRCPHCRPERRALPAMLLSGQPPVDLLDEIHASLGDLGSGRLSEEEVERLLMRWAELVGAGRCIDVLSSEASLRAIIKAMRSWPFNENIQTSGCCILGRVAAYGEKQCVLIASLGGVAAVVEALKTHPHTEAVQEKACWALRQLSMESQCRREVLVHHGLEAIVAALHGHPSALGVLESACMVLANLAADPDARVCIAQVGGVKAVVGSMAPNVESSVLQEAACFLLHNMACTSEYQQLIGESGGFEAVVRAMRAHPDHASLQEGGCSVFHNVANGPVECLEAVSNCSAVEAVIEAMQGHPGHAGVQEKACHALGQVGDVRRQVVELEDRRLHDKIVALGGAEALRKATENFRKDAAATHEAREALSILEL